MEGFIPMVFKSLKKSKTRREYRSLSTPATHSYNIVDFYPEGYNFQYGTSTQQQDPNVDGLHAESKKFSRRKNKSFNHVGYAGGRYSPEASSGKPSKQLVRLRSQRRMFSMSCITGA